MRLIDADALLDDLVFSSEALKKTFTELINDAPTVEMKQKKGKWVVDELYRDSEGNEYHIWVCSRCKVLNYENTPYCPHCGAEMEVEE